MTDRESERDSTRRSFEDARDAVEWPLWTLLRRHVRPFVSLLVVGTVAVFAIYFVRMLPHYILGVAFDAVFTPTRAYRLPLVPDAWIPPTATGQLLFTVGLFVAVGLVQVTSKVLREWAMNGFSLRLQHAIRVDAYDRVQRLEMAFYDDHQTGEVMSILNNDVNELEEFFTEELDSLLHVVAFGTGVVAFMALINWQLMLVTLSVAPAFVLANYWFSGVIERLQDDVRESVGTLNARLENNVGGIATIKAYTTEPFESERVREASATYFETNWSAIRLRSWVYPSMRILTGLTFTVTFLVGGYWVLRGPPLFFTVSLTPGGLISFLIYSRMIMWPMRKVTGVIDQYKSALAAAKRVVGVQEAAMTIPEPADSIGLGDVDGRVQYDDVRFSYGGRSEQAVDGVSFAVEPGETVGIVGPTGAGKSTLVKLLLRFYDPEEGAVRIDDVDVRNVSTQELRNAVGYVGQEPFLFSGSVTDNVAYGEWEADEDVVRKAAELAGAHEFVEDLPDEYDTMVGERGVKLSGGQRQRIAIARAFVDDPPVLVLDEATSHVDNETEVLIQRGIESLIEDRTAFVIAHRLSTVRDADRILVFDEGQIVERGTHEELLDRDGLYANLWNVQVGAVERLPETFVEQTIHTESQRDIDPGEG